MALATGTANTYPLVPAVLKEHTRLRLERAWPANLKHEPGRKKSETGRIDYVLRSETTL